MVWEIICYRGDWNINKISYAGANYYSQVKNDNSVLFIPKISLSISVLYVFFTLYYLANIKKISIINNIGSCN